MDENVAKKQEEPVLPRISGRAFRLIRLEYRMTQHGIAALLNLGNRKSVERLEARKCIPYALVKDLRAINKDVFDRVITELEKTDVEKLLKRLGEKK